MGKINSFEINSVINSEYYLEKILELKYVLKWPILINLIKLNYAALKINLSNVNSFLMRSVGAAVPADVLGM